VATIAIDRMMGYRFISNLAIVRWLFFSRKYFEQLHTSDHPCMAGVHHRSFYKLFCSLLHDGFCMFTEYITLWVSNPVLGENPVRF
jgi:hypothetical protein